MAVLGHPVASPMPRWKAKRAPPQTARLAPSDSGEVLRLSSSCFFRDGIWETFETASICLFRIVAIASGIDDPFFRGPEMAQIVWLLPVRCDVNPT